METSRYFYPHNQYSFIIQRFTEIPSSFEILVQPQDTLQFRLPGAAFCFWALLPMHTGCSAPVLHSAASCSQGSKGGHFRQKMGMDGKGGRSHRKRSYSMRPKNTRILVLKVFSKWQWIMKAFNIIQNNGVVCHSYYLGLTARCRLCTKVKQKLSAQDSEDTRRQMQPPQNPATEPMHGDTVLRQHLWNGLSSKVPCRVWLALTAGEPLRLVPFISKKQGWVGWCSPFVPALS